MFKSARSRAPRFNAACTVLAALLCTAASRPALGAPAGQNGAILDLSPDSTTEVDPGNRTGGLIGNRAVPLLNGADHDEENETES